MHEVPVYRVELVREGSLTVESPAVRRPADAAQAASSYLAGWDREVFIALMLNRKNRIVGVNTVAIGSVAEVIVHPREVFKAAILVNAAAVVLVHNHPSGDPTPSFEDLEVVRRLSDAGSILGIEVLDALVVGHGAGSFVSMREAKMLPAPHERVAEVLREAPPRGPAGSPGKGTGIGWTLLSTNKCPECGEPMMAYRRHRSITAFDLKPDGSIDQESAKTHAEDEEITVECENSGFCTYASTRDASRLDWLVPSGWEVDR